MTIRLPRDDGVPTSATTPCGRAARRASSTCAWCYTGLGPGSRWAARCAVGDPVEISRSQALPIALDRSTEAHLFFGDETSIASAEALIRALPAEAVVLACFEVASTDRRWPEPEVTRPEKHSLGGSRRTTRLGACLLARAPKPPVCELRNRLRDR